MTDAPDSTPFVDFYRQYDVSPVRQDLTDINRHFQRRESLYRLIGIVPSLVRGRTVLEFGPGSGHNAIYTASLAPSKYVLVDANPRGLRDTRETLFSRYGETGTWQVCESLFADFTSESEFDIVLAEGCLPGQRNPVALLRHLASFVAPGGILLITTMSATGYLAEITRRLIRTRSIDVSLPPMQQVEQLRPIFESHYAQLPNASRPFEDWAIDNLIHPFGDVELMSIPEAVDALTDEFDFYSSSPLFRTDLRWYKALHGDTPAWNARAVESYFQFVPNLVDHSLELPLQPAEFGRKLERTCQDVWSEMLASERGSSDERAVAAIDRAATQLTDAAPTVATALQQGVAFLQGRATLDNLERFKRLWGRGQQYVSFIRRS